MSVTKTMAAALLAVALAAPAAAQPVDAGDQAERQPAEEAGAREQADRAREQAERARESAERARERELREYERGHEALERAEWAAAVDRFRAVSAVAGARADAALYWQAYALDKLGQRAEALTALAELSKTFANSRWLSDARALEMQVRQSVGQPVRPEAAGDEELKLLALNALQHSAPEQALPMLRQVLEGTQSLKLKERALFVLAQSRSPEARTILADTARQSNPDLQRRAIDYLGVHGSAENRALLAELYQSLEDVDVKRRILRAYMVSGDRARVLAAATGERSPELRAEAVRQLGVMNAQEELWQLYQKEAAVEVKRQILQAMFIGGGSARLVELAKSEPNAELRRTAVRNLGLMRASSSGQALAEIYSTDKDADIRRAAIQGLFVQNNAEALVALARKETDPAMKRELVQKLSLMRSKVAIDYLMEILGKNE
ncbi:MAG: HEAT repeat domain-containing protein [Acidobacteriota bacterium]